jgi:hypothetical protein
MIRVGETATCLQWLPVTKIQFEHFLSDAHDRHFNAKWYEEVLSLNPRVTPRKITPDNYWNAFLSGVSPAEAQRFAFWCGDGYRLATSEEWSRAYQILSSMPVVDLGQAGILEDLPPRERDLVVHMEAAAEEAAHRSGYERTLADQMLMRLGVLEWVSIDDGWGALGEAFPGFCGNLMSPGTGTPLRPREPEKVRLPCFGFRLIFTEERSA